MLTHFALTCRIGDTQGRGRISGFFSIGEASGQDLGTIMTWTDGSLECAIPGRPPVLVPALTPSGPGAYRSPEQPMTAEVIYGDAWLGITINGIPLCDAPMTQSNGTRPVYVQFVPIPGRTSMHAQTACVLTDHLLRGVVAAP